MCSQIGETLSKIHICSKDYKDYDEGLKEVNGLSKCLKSLNPF